MEATKTQTTNSSETHQPETAEQRLTAVREMMQQNALVNPLEDEADFDARLKDFIQIFQFNSVIAVSIALAILPASGTRLVWEARFGFHFLPKGNTKRSMFWTKRDRRTAENYVRFFLENCGKGDIRLTSANTFLRARKDVSPDEFERIFDLEAGNE